jgi:hypothetical protein
VFITCKIINIPRIEQQIKIVSLTSITQHIEITPGVCGGKPRIAGHRIVELHIVVKEVELLARLLTL